MKTLTIRLPDVLARRIEEESLARRISKSEFVRERLSQPAFSAPSKDSLQEMLEVAWSAKVPSGPRQFRSSKKQKIAGVIRAKKLHRG